MPRYKLSPEEQAAEKERKENLRNIMRGLDVKNFDDLKDVFKLVVSEMLENESAKFWLSVMNGLKNRGLEDILIACVDGLIGFLQKEATASKKKAVAK